MPPSRSPKIEYVDEPHYRQAYHQALVYKTIAGAQPDTLVHTVEALLGMMEQVARFTRGIKQINYLYGWQYDGSDTGYPAFDKVNPRLKRAGDASAADSVAWLMAEAKQRLDAEVSVHINLCDAYEDSPLWDEYVREDLLCRDPNGHLEKAGVWEGRQSYHVCKSREWAAGYTRRRIDAMLEALPLAAAGTIHVDVFNMHPSAWHGTTFADEVKAMIEILRYFRARGIDVTREWFDHEFAGLTPWALHFNLDEHSRLKYPPSVVCGGGSGWNRRHKTRADQIAWSGSFLTPEGGCLYEEAWGESIDCSSPDQPDFAEKFYTRTLPWYFLNRQRALELRHTPEMYAVHFTGDVVSAVRQADRHYTLRQGDRLLVDGGDLFVPALWREKEIIAYTRKGCRREWELPPDWSGVGRVAVHALWPPGPERVTERRAVHGRIMLELQPNEAVYLAPA